MRIVEPLFTIEDQLDGEQILKNIERAGRTCYQSESTADSSHEFVARLIQRGHESVLEHEKITVRFICDCVVSLELVRHRLASYSQESSRFCSYDKDRFGNQITVIEPCFWDKVSIQYLEWAKAMEFAEESYCQRAQVFCA